MFHYGRSYNPNCLFKRWCNTHKNKDRKNNNKNIETNKKVTRYEQIVNDEKYSTNVSTKSRSNNTVITRSTQ